MVGGGTGRRRRAAWVVAAALGCSACAPAVAPWSRPVVEVETTAATAQAVAQAVADCPALAQRLPYELIGDTPRFVASDSPFAYAWGEDPVVVVCGADQPVYPPDQPLIGMNGVLWFVEPGGSETVWTTVDRRVPVQVRMPVDTNGAAATALTSVIRLSIPARTSG